MAGVPTIARESIAAADHLPGTMTLCSSTQGWTSLLLRRYDEPLEAEFETLPTADQLIVLVGAGRCTIEGRSERGWQSFQYQPGDLGMTPPGEASRLRFYGPEAHQTLQLHIPAALLERAEDAAGKPLPHLHELRTHHSLAATVIRELERGLAAGAPAIYAESAIHYLLLQLLLDAGALGTRRQHDRASRRAQRVDAYMRANLSNAITLADMADVIDMSVFQLIRFFRATWGTTPALRLATLRLERGRYLLEATHDPVTSIALECGYENPAHFAAAYRRHCGLTPTEYRKARG